MKHITKIAMITALCGLILNTNAQQKITLTDIYQNGTFYAKGVDNFRSMADGEHYTILQNNKEIVQFDYKTSQDKQVLLALDANSPLSHIAGYELSPNEDKLLIWGNIKPIYRHSYTADYYIYDRTTKQYQALINYKGAQLAAFAPQGNAVAFVQDNNLYLKDNNTILPITTDGKFNHILNGISDWVYEEEFALKRAYQWSPNANFIAYLRFDETNVPEFSMTMYDTQSNYTGQYTYKYPKAGEQNSLVDLYIYNRDTNNSLKVNLPNDPEQYIPRIKWTYNNKLVAAVLNRHQNHLKLYRIDPNTGNAALLYEETNKYYIDEISDDTFDFTPDNKYFYMLSERSGYKHLYLHDLNTGKELRPLTTGTQELVSLHGYNPERKRFYYTIATERGRGRMLCSIGLDGKKLEKLTPETGTAIATFSNKFQYFLQTYSTANTPAKISLCNSTGKELRVLEDNAKLQATTKRYNFVQKEFIDVPLQDGTILNGYILKPNQLEPNKQYPVLMIVYGGPGSQQVANSWNYALAWHQYLVQQGYIVACVDNRGTGYRGEAFKKCTYMRLGEIEVQDQIAAAKYLGQLDYIDASRIGIWGWSYGGYMSSLCMLTGNDVFKAGIAVAPVTSWRFYDSVYTERYMRTPQENSSGYDAYAPINLADGLKGSFLLIHGSADDNVHVQNALILAEQLVQANKHFDFHIYTDKNHGIYGGNTSLHIYTKMSRFIIDKL